jgi:hypothetical protein
VKRQLTRNESIQMLASAIRSTDIRDLEDFVRRIWDSLGYEGHEAIRREFRECSFETLDPEPAEDCGHDGEDTDPNCPSCQAAFRQSALDAGIPASVFDGKTKLTDHFSPEYIKAQANPKGDKEDV